MIALFPMLVSNTVSRNIIPGIAKVLENYLIVYGIAGIMHRARKDVKGAPNYSFKGKKIIQRESDNPLEDFFYHEVVFEQSDIINPIVEAEFSAGWENQDPEDMSNHELIKYGKNRRTDQHNDELERRYPETDRSHWEKTNTPKGKPSGPSGPTSSSTSGGASGGGASWSTGGASQIGSFTDPGTKGKQSSQTKSGNKPLFTWVDSGPEPTSQSSSEELEKLKAKAEKLRDKRDKLIASNQANKAKEAKQIEDDAKKTEEEWEQWKKKEEFKAKVKKKAKDASVSITTPDMKSISLEPTWMKTDMESADGVKTSGIIGVKVVPYPVKSDARLAHLLMYDRQVSNLQSLAIRWGRKVENAFYRAWKIAWKFMTLGIGGAPAGGMGVTGDPKHDILARRTILKANKASDIFVLVNQADLTDDFYTSANGILKLFRMGWSSIIIADDVNRRVSFCMRELKGMCTMMPYTMLYQTMSQAKVYEDLEDAKRSASSIFKVQRKAFTKIVGEGIAQRKIENFGMQNMPLFERDFITEMNLIDENIGSFMQKMTPTKMKALLPNVLKGNNKDVPKLSSEKILKLGMKMNPDFKKSYILAKRVLDNSTPEVRGEVVDLAALGIAARASMSVSRDISTDIMVSTKEAIKNYIMSYRKNKDESKAKRSNMPREHYAEAVFGWVGITGLVAMVGAFYGYGVPWVYRAMKSAFADVNVTLPAIETGMRKVATWVVDSFKDNAGELATHLGPSVSVVMIMVMVIVATQLLLRRK